MNASRPALALNLSRLFEGALRPAPRGIDQVELLYARHFLQAWPSDCFSVVTTPWGVRMYDRAKAQRGMAVIEALWGEDGGGRSVGAIARRIVDLGMIIGQPVQAALPRDALYLNVGHVGLAARSDWLNRRPDVRTVFMLHDVIPHEAPEHVSAREGRYFQRIVGKLRRADGLILNSQTAAAAVESHLPHLDCPRLVSRLPVPPAFLTPPAGEHPPVPYFIAIGQVERRKNLLLLAEVWRRLNAAGEAPRLMIVGAPGDASAALARQLAACDPGGKVSLHPRLATPQLRALLAGATALLAPSLAEGFGLPVAEALTLGVPVIASDIPAHREVGGANALYLPPDDAQAWAGALAPLIEDPSALVALRARASGYAPRTTSAYFEEVEAFLDEIAARPN